MKYQVSAGQLRMDMDMSGIPAARGVAEGMYVLMNESDSTMATVMPAQKLAMIMNMKMALMTRMIPKFSVKDGARSVVKDLGAGERLIGHPTHRYLVTQAATLVVTLSGQTCERSMDSVSELWVATDLDASPVQDSVLSRVAGISGAGGGMLEQLSALRKDYPKGTPLRTVVKSTSPGADGTAVTVTVTSETTEATHGPVDPAVFALPTGYTTMDTRPMLSTMTPEALESMANAAGGPGSSGVMKAYCGGKSPQQR
jgi:hypothetical protein